MNFQNFRRVFRRSPVENGQPARRDSGAAAIILLMMSLVFVPIALAHLAANFEEHFAPGQLAGYVHMLMPVTASN